MHSVTGEGIRDWICLLVTVPTNPSTNPVDQPSDLLAIRPAHTTCNTVCIWARPIDLQVNLLFNRPQGLDYTWPRFGSASQVCFENSPALRTLTTSTFRSEEEEEKGSLPGCLSLPSYLYKPCTMCVKSVHARGDIHTTTILSLRVS